MKHDFSKFVVYDFSALDLQANSTNNCFGCNDCDAASCDMCDNCDHGGWGGGCDHGSWFAEHDGKSKTHDSQPVPAIAAIIVQNQNILHVCKKERI